MQLRTLSVVALVAVLSAGSEPGRFVAVASLLPLSSAELRFNPAVKTLEYVGSDYFRPVRPFLKDTWALEHNGNLPAENRVHAYTSPPEVSFPGLSFSYQEAVDPPDGALAVGPQHVVEVVNTRVAVFLKSGTKLTEDTLERFFRLSATQTLVISDPRASYDHFTGRYFLLVISVDFSLQTSTLYIALSRSADPTGGYCQYRFDMTLSNGVRSGIHADFPGLGFDKSAFYLTVKRMEFGTQVLHDAELLMVSKATLTNCPAQTVVPTWQLTGLFPDLRPVSVVQPAITFGEPGTQYFVSTAENGGNYIGLWTLTGAESGSPQLSSMRSIAVPLYTPPPRAHQKGSPAQLSFLRAEIPSSVIYRDGSLWFAHAASSPLQTSAVAWYEMHATTGNVLQRQLLYFENGHYGHPALMVDRSGNMVLILSVSGSDFFPGTAFTVRLRTDPLNTVQQVLMFASGRAPHSPVSDDGRVRWGDYHGIALDPDGQRVWIEGEFAKTSIEWGTTIAAVRATLIRTPTAYRVSLSSTAPAAGSPVTVTAQLIAADGVAVALPGRVVTWSKSGTGGAFSSPTSVTDGTGSASVIFTTSTTPGITHVVRALDTAGVAGSSPSFTTQALRAGAFVQSARLVLLTPQDVGPSFSVLDERADSIEEQALVITNPAPYASGIELLRAWGFVDSWERQLYSTASSGVYAVISQATLYSTTSGAAGDYRINLSLVKLPFVPSSLGAGIGDESTAFRRDLSLRARDGSVVEVAELLFVFRSGTVSHTLDFYAYGGQMDSALAVQLARKQASRSASQPQSQVPTTTIYLPNITKTLGGPQGWHTPFIVQNVGSVTTDLEVSFFRFSDGAQIAQRLIRGVRPGTSFADIPNNDPDLPSNAQYSVVVRSFGSEAIAVVNEHQGTGSRAESMSYVGLTRGSDTVFLPYVAKQTRGWTTTFIIQNLGNSTANVTVLLISYDGTKRTTLTRTVPPGRSRFVDPSIESTIIAGVEYSAKITADQPIGVVANAHNDSPGVRAPMAFSYNGPSANATTQVHVPYVPRNSDGVGRTSRIVIQNTGTADATPTLTFLRIPAGGHTVFSAPVRLSPGAAWSLDTTRTADGTGVCPATGGGTCLGEGDHSLIVAGGQFAVLNIVTTTSSALGFTGSSMPGKVIHLPNVTRTLGGPSGWTTPIVIQSAGASSATLRWYRFADGALTRTQTVSWLGNGSSIRIDPRDVPQLPDNTQYSVVIEAFQPIHAVVTELNFEGGDGAMAYEGFVASSAAP